MTHSEPSSIHPAVETAPIVESSDDPLVGAVHFGDLGRATPISRKFGFDRGTCIDRFYIERFLSASSADIRGRVLEVAEDSYTRRFGGDRVTQSDVLHAVPGNRRATIVGDLTQPDAFPANTFDCVILTQTLQHIYDVPAALRTVRHMLSFGGVALFTVPGISQISRYDMDRWGDFWRFTTLSLARLLVETFPHDERVVQSHGNVHASIAFLHGLGIEDVGEQVLVDTDEDYQLVLTARVQKLETPL